MPQRTVGPLLLVNQQIPSNISMRIVDGLHPRLDYLELAQRLNATIVGRQIESNLTGKILLRLLDSVLHTDFQLASAAIHQHDQCSGFISMWEWTGVPLAILQRQQSLNSPQILIAHHLLAPAKRLVTKLSGILQHVRRIICLAENARTAYEAYFRLPASALQTVHYGVDHHFFHSIYSVPEERAILSVGSSKRDYVTLLRAVHGTQVTLRLRASSNWNPRNVVRMAARQSNLELLQQLSYTELREQYARARFVVVPLRLSYEFSAGITSALEASAMGKAVIATRTPSMAEYVRHGETGLLVEPYNVREMKNAIDYLLTNPAEARRMGECGRQWVERERSLDKYVDALTFAL